jgi:hypothetical protein
MAPRARLRSPRRGASGAKAKGEPSGFGSGGFKTNLPGKVPTYCHHAAARLAGGWRQDEDILMRVYALAREEFGKLRLFGLAQPRRRCGCRSPPQVDGDHNRTETEQKQRHQP